MIKASISRSNGLIRSVKVSGHANYAEHGQDLVCAAVSAIMFGICNTLDEYKTNADINIKNNSIEIAVDVDNISQMVMNTCYIQLKTIEETQSKFIKIKITEV